MSDVVFVMNRFGYVKLVDKALFDKNEEQLRSENVRFVPCKTNSRLAVFTKEGILHYLKADAIPLGKVKDKVRRLTICVTIAVLMKQFSQYLAMRT